MAKSITRALVAVVCATTLSFGLIGCTINVNPPAKDGKGTQTQSPEGTPSENDSPAQLAALEAYAAAERAQLPAVLEAYPDLYSDAQVTTRGADTIVFSYFYLDQIDPAEIQADFDALIPGLQNLCDTAVFPAMQSMGVKGTLYVSYEYYNPDGSSIWEKTFASS